MLPVKKMSKCRTRTTAKSPRVKGNELFGLSEMRPCRNLPHAACDNCGYVNAKITLKDGKKEQES